MINNDLQSEFILYNSRNLYNYIKKTYKEFKNKDNNEKLHMLYNYYNFLHYALSNNNFIESLDYDNFKSLSKKVLDRYNSIVFYSNHNKTKYNEILKYIKLSYNYNKKIYKNIPKDLIINIFDSNINDSKNTNDRINIRQHKYINYLNTIFNLLNDDELNDVFSIILTRQDLFFDRLEYIKYYFRFNEQNKKIFSQRAIEDLKMINNNGDFYMYNNLFFMSDHLINGKQFLNEILSNLESKSNIELGKCIHYYEKLIKNSFYNYAKGSYKYKNIDNFDKIKLIYESLYRFIRNSGLSNKYIIEIFYKYKYNKFTDNFMNYINNSSILQ